MQNSNTGIEYRDLTLEEIQELGKNASEGDLKARERLILTHMGLVNMIMLEFSGRGVDNDDLYQEGCYGLVLAVDNYDYRRRNKLSTYAVHWIRKRMQVAISKQNINAPFSVEPDFHRDLCLYRQTYVDFQERFDRSPSFEEISKATGFSEERIHKLQCHLFSFLSLDAPKRGPQDSSPRIEGSTPPEQSWPSAEDQVIQQITTKDIKETELPVQSVLLTRREREALMHRLGFTAYGQPETWNEISAATGMSKASAQRAYLEAIRKLREAIEQSREDIPETNPYTST